MDVFIHNWHDTVISDKINSNSLVSSNNPVLAKIPQLSHISLPLLLVGLIQGTHTAFGFVFLKDCISEQTLSPCVKK